MKSFLVSLATFVVLIEFVHSFNPGNFDPVDYVAQTVWPVLLGQKANNAKGSREEFKEFALSNKSNEDRGNMSTQDIIKQSGFGYEDYKVLSSDNYVTILTRIVNPLADKRQLKQPPIMLMHGGIVSSTAYVWASSAQHHPEEYPQRATSKPFTSWNRSLAFVLANNGFDVWLIGKRGADVQEDERVGYGGGLKTLVKSIKEQKLVKKTLWKKINFIKRQKEAKHFWSFTLDDEIEFGIPRQIDKVLSVTGAKNVSLFTYSQSTLMAMSLLAENRHYAQKVHTLITMAPIINDKGTNKLVRFFYNNLCKRVPDDLGTLVTTQLVFTKQLRHFIAKINSDKYLRYTLMKAIATTFFGSSAKYETLLEPSVVWHSLMPTSFLQLKHYCQQAVAGRIQKYDYGLIKNLHLYGRPKPPHVNIADLHVENWMLISGSNDNFASPDSVAQVLKDVKHPKPFKHINVEGFNHLDLIAGVDNGRLVNKPILDFYNHFQLPPTNSSVNNSTG